MELKGSGRQHREFEGGRIDSLQPQIVVEVFDPTATILTSSVQLQPTILKKALCPHVDFPYTS